MISLTLKIKYVDNIKTRWEDLPISNTCPFLFTNEKQARKLILDYINFSNCMLETKAIHEIRYEEEFEGLVGYVSGWSIA